MMAYTQAIGGSPRSGPVVKIRIDSTTGDILYGWRTVWSINTALTREERRKRALEKIRARRQR